jgi:hypothetical protein
MQQASSREMSRNEKQPSDSALGSIDNLMALRSLLTGRGISYDDLGAPETVGSLYPMPNAPSVKRRAQRQSPGLGLLGVDCKGGGFLARVTSTDVVTL